MMVTAGDPDMNLNTAELSPMVTLLRAQTAL